LKKLILLVGMPASGKSTLAAKLIAKGFSCLNADSIREELYGDAILQGDPAEVFKIFFERLEELLKADSDIVVDNTNLKFQHRKQIIDKAKGFGYADIELWFLDMPFALCAARNGERERRIPDDALKNMFSIFEREGRPKRSEGRVIVIRPGKDENELRFFPQS